MKNIVEWAKTSNVKTISMPENFKTDDLPSLYDLHCEFTSQRILMRINLNMFILMQRKFTYKGSNVVKTDYLHANIFFNNGKEHSYIRENKDRSLTVSSFYR